MHHARSDTPRRVAALLLLCASSLSNSHALVSPRDNNALQQQSWLSDRREARRCATTLGSWCGQFDQQQPLTGPVHVPRGAQPCPAHKEWGVCSGVGVCDHDIGVCDCPAGWQGQDCSTPLLRPCTVSFRARKDDPPVGHIDAEGRDLDHSVTDFTESRCIGVCDPVLGRCFCDGKHKRINPPPGSRPGTPPVAAGRPLCNHWCQPTEDDRGNKFPWGGFPWSDIYGPSGWCNADQPRTRNTPHCLYEGFGGSNCTWDQPLEHVCMNQCSGHGECDQGFCKCDPGWYGSDCAKVREGEPVSRGRHEPGHSDHRPWLATSTRTPYHTAMRANAGAPQQRKRPLIYVYDMPAKYTGRMMQYRVEKYQCTWRSWGAGNESSAWTHTLYGVELMLHELMLQSEHRTLNPEEADFFYVPIYLTCFIFPIHSWADGPWWYTPGGPRVMHVTHMMLEARDWIQKHYPWWNRRQGRDHIWLMAHDEGACYAPTAIFNTSIMLVHWGRKDLHHRSNTAFTPDNYTQDHHHSDMDPRGWTHLHQGHPCYDPNKDLVIPVLKMAGSFSHSRLLANRLPQKRNITLFFKGDVGRHRLAWYSRGIRQKLYNLSRGGWAQQHSILVGGYEDVPGNYGELLTQARFCLVAPGDGWSSRAEDAVLHGCIPLVIMDEVDPVYGSVLDWDKFSVRVRESDMEKIPEILGAISLQRERAMRRALRQVWHRFVWTSHELLRQPLDQLYELNRERWQQRLQSQPGSALTGDGGGAGDMQKTHGHRLPPPQYPHHEDDAFHTLLQWLYSRIPATR